jgi:hypothetical protein
LISVLFAPAKAHLTELTPAGGSLENEPPIV